MSLATKLTDLTNAMGAFGVALKSKILQHVPIAVKADNALKFANKTYAEIIQENEDDLETHVDNPLAHNLNVASFNTYTKTEILNRLGQKIKSGIIPISKASISSNTCVLSYSGVTSRWQISTSALFIVMCGISWSFPSTVNHTLHENSPFDYPDIANIEMTETLYLYAELFGGELYFTMSTTPKVETLTCMFLGSSLASDLDNGFGFVSTTTPFPTEMDDGPIIRIDTARISQTAKGNAIPVSDNTGSLMWT